MPPGKYINKISELKNGFTHWWLKDGPCHGAETHDQLPGLAKAINYR
jgi:hypothetical protein